MKKLFATGVIALITACTATNDPVSSTDTNNNNTNPDGKLHGTVISSVHFNQNQVATPVIFDYDSTTKHLNFTWCPNISNPDSSLWAKGYYTFNSAGEIDTWVWDKYITTEKTVFQFENNLIKSYVSIDSTGDTTSYAVYNSHGNVVESKSVSTTYDTAGQVSETKVYKHTMEYTYYPNNLPKTQRIRGNVYADTTLSFTYKTAKSFHGITFSDSVYILSNMPYGGYSLVSTKENAVKLHSNGQISDMYYLEGGSSLVHDMRNSQGIWGGMVYLDAVTGAEKTDSWYQIRNSSEIVIDPKTGAITLTPIGIHK